MYAGLAMLRRLHVKNFKLLRDVRLEFEEDAPTVLIGPNASGKSSLLEVLDFLRRCADDGLESALVAHGGINAIRTAGATGPVEIDATWMFTKSDKLQSADAGLAGRTFHLRWTFAVDGTRGGQGVLAREALYDGETRLVGNGADGHREILDESTPKPRYDRLPDELKLAFDGRADRTRNPGLFHLRVILLGSQVLGVLASAPAWARSAAERASARDAVVISRQAFLDREGLGLAVVLYNLQTDHAEAWSRLTQAFRAEFPFVKRIVFPPDPGGSRISFAIEDDRFAGRRVYASEMSDGMITYLCLLSLVLHPNQLGVLALDEPDAHLHPSAVRRFMALAHDEHLRRSLVIATHSNAVLDELRDPAASVRIVEPSPDGARIRRLDPEALAAWRGEYSLSDLRRTGLLDQSNTAYESDVENAG